MTRSADSAGQRRVTARVTAVAAVVCSLALVTPYHAVAQAHAAAFVDQGTVVYADARSAGDIDPASNETASFDDIARNVDEPLVALDGTSLDRFKPVLATSWTSNADKSVWTFYLRHGVRFHYRPLLHDRRRREVLAGAHHAGRSDQRLRARALHDATRSKQIKVARPLHRRSSTLGRPQPSFWPR